MAVRVVERACNLAGDPHRIGDRKLTLASEARAERFPVHVRHHIEEIPIRVARIVKREDMRVLQVGRRADLGEKAGGAHRGSQIGVKHLYRDMPVVLQVARQVDGGHSTLPEFALDRVSVSEGARQTLEVRSIRVHAAQARSTLCAAAVSERNLAVVLAARHHICTLFGMTR